MWRNRFALPPPKQKHNIPGTKTLKPLDTRALLCAMQIREGSGFKVEESVFNENRSLQDLYKDSVALYGFRV